MGTPRDWQISKKKVNERGENLLETGQWSDCSFIVGSEPHQQVFPGHKLFLAMSSPVFEAMFYGGMAEKNDHPIPILDVQPDAFKALLEYIYTDKINLTSFDQACELCYGAKKYMLPHLVEECTKYLWSDLYPKNACRAYEFAKLFEEPILMEKCLQIICTQTEEVLSESSFEDVELSTLITIFEQDYLNVESELVIFKAITRFAAKHGNESGVVVKKPRLESNDESAQENGAGSPTLRDVIKKIRFLTLTPQQFAEGPASSDLLTQDEKFAILMNISSPAINTPMPEGFSTETKTRKKFIKCGSSFVQPTYLASPNTLLIPGSEHGDRESIFNKQSRGRENMSSYYEPSTSVAIVPNVSAEEHVRNMPKLYCTRTLVQGSNFLNTSSTECSVTLSVDRNICVIGVQVPSQEHADMSDHNAMYHQNSYSELLYACLVDADGSRLTYAHYSARVSYRSMIELLFNRPVYIQRNKLYKIGVTFNKQGWYPVGNCIPRSTCDQVTFKFGGGSFTDSVQEGLIRTVIFSY